MTMLCTVMAWGKTYQVGTYAQLKSALEAGDATLIELTADITYDGAWRTVTDADLNAATTVEPTLCITNSLVLDGKGFKLIGWGKHDVAIGAVNGVINSYPTSTDTSKPKTNLNTIHRVSLAIHPNADAAINVTIQNISVGNQLDNKQDIDGNPASLNNRYFGIAAFDGVAKLTMDNVNIAVGKYCKSAKKNTWAYPGSQQGFFVTGASETPIDLDIKDSYIQVGNSGYTTYFLKPITGKFANSTIEGWAGLYFKYRNIQLYGEVAGTRGSNVICDACNFICKNVHDGVSNSFAMFPMEDDGITLTLNNCSMNPEQIGDQAQSLVSIQAATRTSGYQPIVCNISGDNTHIYSIGLAAAILNQMAQGEGYYRNTVTGDLGGEGLAINVPLTVNITGGTFTVNPDDIAYQKYDGETWGGTTQGVTIDDTQYEVKEVSQGGNIVYRVVKKAAEKEPGVLYDLNDNVQSQGDGQNPTTSFELSDGSAMTLNQATTKAGYVEVSNATTVTVATDQTLVINNGLDVQGASSVVTAQPGSALVIGEGGIVTESSANIVVEANQNGAASLLLDPTITVNQTPELTVKMTVPAEHAGYEMLGSGQYRHWFRFAMPVEHMAATWAKEPNVPTFLYGWNYSVQEWAQVGVTEMVPFAGYTLSPDKEISTNTAVTYTFKGQLLGNTNCTLNLNHHGYNFFGNSYTGYISILKLVDQIMGDAKIDGTVWMWNGEKYEGIGLEYLRQYGETPGLVPSWQKEVAPMQTFVLRLTGDDFSSTDINYADAIWGNPRYDAAKTALNAAPARRAEINDNAIIRMTIEANGQKESVVMIENSNYSDAYDRGYDAIKYMNENSFNTYVGINGENYGTVATDNLEGKMLSIKTNNELAYSITFDFVAGEEYALRDNATNQVIAIEEGATYEFAAQPNSTVEGRFEIVGRAKMPTSIENTEVKANVKGIYTIMGQYLGEDFDILPAGVYVVNGVKIVK